MTRQMADKWIKRAAKETNINRTNKGIHCHMFRHTFAIHLLEKNKTDPRALFQLKDLLDHSRLDITQTYTQFLPEDKQKVLNKTFDN